MLAAKRVPTDHNPAGFMWRIWEVEFKGRTFWIDGQNHEHTSREWEISELTPCSWGGKNPDITWCDIVDTKKDALIWIEQFVNEQEQAA